LHSSASASARSRSFASVRPSGISSTRSRGSAASRTSRIASSSPPSATTSFTHVRGSAQNAAACAHVSAQRSVTPGSLGDHMYAMRSCAIGGGAMPLVSTSTRSHWPAAAASSSRTPACCSGSPPVTTSSGAGPNARSSANASASVHARPPPASHV
jgi:hypothetical protein